MRKYSPRHGQHARDSKKLNPLKTIVRSIVSGVAISLSVALIVAVMLRVIGTLAPGEMMGGELEQYLIGKTAKVLSQSREDIVIQTLTISPDDTTVVLCGDYEDQAALPDWKSFFCVFERGRETVFNKLTNTKAAYSCRYALASEKSFLFGSFQFQKCEFVDLDDHSPDEIRILAKCHYGNYAPYIKIFLQRFDDGWHAISPDLVGILKTAEEKKASGGWFMPCMNEYLFSDPNGDNQAAFYGLYGDSEIYKTNNPFWGGYDFCSCVEIMDENEEEAHFAIAMSRITDHGVFLEPNWNLGEVLYISEKEVDLVSIVERKWGWRYEDGEDDNDAGGRIVLYRDDVE